MLRNDVTARRSYRDITAEILRIARKGANKTRIVYKANLNFEILGKYLERLEKAGLISYDRQTVKTTQKGREYIKHYEGLQTFGI